MDDTNATRNLREDITYANTQLAKWRRDGNADRITFWPNRLDELVDRLPRTAQLEESATSTWLQSRTRPPGWVSIPTCY